MQDEVEVKARELLAAEYERSGFASYAGHIRARVWRATLSTSTA